MKFQNRGKANLPALLPSVAHDNHQYPLNLPTNHKLTVIESGSNFL